MPTLVQSPWIENKSITRWSEVRSLCPCSSCSPASARCHLFRLIINFGLKFSVAVWIWNAPPLHVSCVKGFGANWWMGFGKCLDHEDLPVPVPAQTDTLMICWHSGGGYGNWEEGIEAESRPTGAQPLGGYLVSEPFHLSLCFLATTRWAAFSHHALLP